MAVYGHCKCCGGDEWTCTCSHGPGTGYCGECGLCSYHCDCCPCCGEHLDAYTDCPNCTPEMDQCEQCSRCYRCCECRTFTHEGYHVTYDPKPIPTRAHDWNFAHEGYDGPPDTRHGTAASSEAARRAIDERLEDER